MIPLPAIPNISSSAETVVPRRQEGIPGSSIDLNEHAPDEASLVIFKANTSTPTSVVYKLVDKQLRKCGE